MRSTLPVSPGRSSAIPDPADRPNTQGVTLVVPAYDEEAGIEAALASLRAGAGVADEAARQRVEAATRR